MKERISVVDPAYNRERPFNVFFADGKLTTAVDRLGRHEEIHVDGCDKTSPNELDGLLRADGPDTVDVLVVRSATKLINDARQIMADATGLSLVVRAGIGTDNIDDTFAAENGVVVENTPMGNVDAVVSKTLADIVHVASLQFRGGLALRSGSVDKPKWDEDIDPFKGKTFGVVGLGNIGSRVALEIMERGGNVIGYDPYARPEGVETASLEDVCGRADVMTIHAAMTESSRDMIGEQQFRLIKDGVILIDNSRGGIVNEAALLAALNGGRVAAAAKDVFTYEGKGLVDDAVLETLPDDKKRHVLEVLRPLVAHPRMVPTMHAAANSREAQSRNGLDTASQIVTFAEGRGISNGVNFPSLALPSGVLENGTSYRLMVLNRNVPGVHRTVAEAVSGLHPGFNVDGGMTLPAPRNRQFAALVQEVTFRKQSSENGPEVIPHAVARQILETIEQVNGVLGVRMVRVDRSP